MALARDYLGRFISPSAKQAEGATYAVKDTQGQTRYFREGKRISAQEWQGRKEQFDTQRREQIARDNQLRQRLERQQQSRLATQAEPRRAPPHIEESVHGASGGNHVKDMGTVHIDAIASIEDVKAQVASFPWLQLNPTDIQVVGVKFNPETGGYDVHYYANFSSYYDDDTSEEPPELDDFDLADFEEPDLFPDFGESPYE